MKNLCPINEAEMQSPVAVAHYHHGAMLWLFNAVPMPAQPANELNPPLLPGGKLQTEPGGDKGGAVPAAGVVSPADHVVHCTIIGYSS